MAVEDGVRTAIAEALAIPIEQVQLQHYLTDDLGAESLDYLDVVFRLESQFDIQITRGEMERAARGEMSDEDFAPDGVVSELGLERLRTLIPESSERIAPGLKPAHILELFQVRTFARIVREKLAKEAP